MGGGRKLDLEPFILNLGGLRFGCNRRRGIAFVRARVVAGPGIEAYDCEAVFAKDAGLHDQNDDQRLQQSAETVMVLINMMFMSNVLRVMRKAASVPKRKRKF